MGILICSACGCFALTSSKGRVIFWVATMTSFAKKRPPGDVDQGFYGSRASQLFTAGWSVPYDLYSTPETSPRYDLDRTRCLGLVWVCGSVTPAHT